MSTSLDRASRWIYRGVWSTLVDVFRVPDEPPDLPARIGDTLRAFQPAQGFLEYLKFYFWLVLIPIDLVILGGWVVLVVNEPFWGWVLSPVFWGVAIIPDIFAYIAIHLRFDTTWYVMSGRSIRIRRGIWTIKEVSITFENVQNVRVSQGPLQRYFGIADVLIETAGASSSEGGGVGNQGRIEGVADAPAIRDQIMQRVRASRSAGLGDEKAQTKRTGAWSVEQVSMLREIRDLIAAG